MTKIIAHRGASKAAPQNTLAAFKKAKAMGAHGFENDVHLTKDGVIVVCHNPTIDATSNGTGAICDMTLEELRQYDFGSYFSPEFAGEKIPTLKFYEVAQGLEIVNVEIKTSEQRFVNSKGRYRPCQGVRLLREPAYLQLQRGSA